MNKIWAYKPVYTCPRCGTQYIGKTNVDLKYCDDCKVKFVLEENPKNFDPSIIQELFRLWCLDHTDVPNRDLAEQMLSDMIEMLMEEGVYSTANLKLISLVCKEIVDSYMRFQEVDDED